MKSNKINIVTLGCSKNLVDSELLLKQLQENNFEVLHDSNDPEAKIIIINTCGFIADAKEESIDMIMDYIEAKKNGNINKLFVMGCLSERYREQLEAEIPEVDKFFGKFQIKDIILELRKDYKYDIINERVLTTPKHFAYLKISEGCNRTCSFCAIPIITGKYHSRTIESLVNEAKYLAKQGVKELLVIAQDLTYYGIDIYKKPSIAQLAEELSKVEGIEWIKLHYAYPNNFPLDLLQIIKNNNKVCAYLDMALQHSSSNMLKLMRRNINKEQTIELINKIREEIPNIALRTTLMVGHPGETEEDFNELVQFVKDMKFDRMGAFSYSEEDDTYSAINYSDNIDSKIKKERLDIIIEKKKKISYELNLKKIDKTFKVIIDKETEDFYVGRTEFDSYEVDPEVLITKNKELEIGEFYNVKITGVDHFDLFGEIE